MQRFYKTCCQLFKLPVMKKIIFAMLLFFVVTQLFTACKKTLDDSEPHPVALPSGGSSVVVASNRFAFNFLKSSMQQDTTASNKLISPLSIYLALSMLYNGADNATKDSMANVLQLSGINIDDLNAVCKSMIQQLPEADSKVQLSIANSIWYNNIGPQPLPAFLNTVTDSYEATMQPLDFTNPASTALINNWVAQHTNNKIQKVLDGIDPGALMYLINAIYFNGAWKNAFATNQTVDNNFQLQDGSTVSVPFMNQQIMTNRYSDSLMDVVELPYGSGKSYSMYIILPKNGPISQFASLMDASMLNNAINHMDSVQIQLSLPSWEYAYSIDNMYPELSALGMDIAFSDKADFSKMYNTGNVSITKAVHKTYIKVNEEGTEAAAVTAIGVATAAAFNLPVNFNRPFLYTIIEKQTGIITFVGIVNNPSQH